MARIRVDTPRDDYAATLEAIVSLVTSSNAAPAHGRLSAWHPRNAVRRDRFRQERNSVWLLGQPLKRDLEARPRSRGSYRPTTPLLCRLAATDGAAAGADGLVRCHRGHRSGAGTQYAAAYDRAERDLPGSGDTTRCRGRPAMSCRVLVVTVASRLFGDVSLRSRDATES